LKKFVFLILFAVFSACIATDTEYLPEPTTAPLPITTPEPAPEFTPTPTPSLTPSPTPVPTPSPSPMPMYETKAESEVAIAMSTLKKILSSINIAEGESGAFDISINLETGMGGGTNQHINISMDINMKKISDGGLVEMLTSTELDLGDVMGGFFRGTELSVGTYSLMTVCGEVLDSRLIVSGMELSQETINTLGVYDLFTLGGFNIEEIILEMLRQNLTISHEALEELEIIVELPYSDYCSYWSVLIWGEEAELEFALAMLPIDTQDVEIGEALVFLSMYADNAPHRAIIEIYWKMPVGDTINEFFAVIRVDFNSIGDEVVIELP